MVISPFSKEVSWLVFLASLFNQHVQMVSMPFSMVFLWVSYGFYGFPMVLLWFPYGFPRFSYGFPMFLWSLSPCSTPPTDPPGRPPTSQRRPTAPRWMANRLPSMTWPSWMMPWASTWTLLAALKKSRKVHQPLNDGLHYSDLEWFSMGFHGDLMVI